MEEHYNYYEMKNFAATIAECMDLPLPDTYAPSISWAAKILKQRLGGTADRAVLYHADAVAMYMWQKYTNIFEPVYRNTSMTIPYRSTIPSVTPVAHASMYTGLDPKDHGIQVYARPQLTCSTLYDELLKAGKKPIIVAQSNSSFHYIFQGRDMEYLEAPTAAELQEIALDVIASDKYDVVSIHTFDYDNAAHAFAPESKEALNALSLEAEGFDRIANALDKYRGKHRTLLTYSPDHGQHPVGGGRGTHGSLQTEDMNVVQFYGTIV